MSRSLPLHPPVPPAANGLVLYRGPSLLDQGPIIAVLTGLWRPSANRKTGAMLQTWILRSDRSPIEALRIGADASICGTCPLRGSPEGKDRRCYVNLGRAPLAVYLALGSGVYRETRSLTDVARAGRGRLVRLGSYGDPAAVPAEIWLALVSRALRFTGYTHQWDRPDFDPRLLDVCMASVETEEQIQDLQRRYPGARHFRVRTPGAPVMPSEMQCPAAAEAGTRLRCEACGACNGRAGMGRSISTEAHGALALRAWQRG